MSDSEIPAPSSEQSPEFHFFSPLQSAPPSLDPRKFTLTALPTTDVWHKPSPTPSSPPHTAFNAPTFYQSLRLSRLKSARVTLASAPWNTLYDQAGLLLCLGKPTDGSPKQWIKAGIEFFAGKPRASVVVCDRWADWSVGAEMSGEGVEVEFQREIRPDGTRGSALLVFVRRRADTGEKVPSREVTWVFSGEEDLEQEAWVGCIVARPDKEVEASLEVQFEGFEIELF